MNLRDALVGSVCAAAFAALVVAGLRPQAGRAGVERSASAALRSIVRAEEDFRTNDRDRNGVFDYWTADVAGLHDFTPPGETSPIRLISAHLARADDRRPDAVPFGGYWFSADDRDDRIGRSSRVGRHKTHFLFTAYPAGRTRGPILGVNESEPVYRWDRRTNSPEWPSEAELQANWSRGD